MSEKHSDEFNKYVLNLTGKLSKYLGEDNTRKMLASPEQSAAFRESVDKLVGAAHQDYTADLVASRVNKTIAKDVAKEVRDTTLLAYDDWRWYGDAAAKGLIGAGAVFGVAMITSYFLGGKKSQSQSSQPTRVDLSDPFSGGSYTASSRPTAARFKADNPQDTNIH